MFSRYLFSTIIIFTFFYLHTYAQTGLLNVFKISSHLPTQIYSSNVQPSFKIILNSKSKIKGKLQIKLKKITEENFRKLFETKLKLNEGYNQYEFNSKVYDFKKIEPEFYEIYSQFITDNSNYYSDTLTFVINHDSLIYKPSKPANVESFWYSTFSKLDSISPNFAIDTISSKETENSKIYKLSFNGFDSMVIRSWYCIPKNIEKSPAVIILPSYGNTAIQLPNNFYENGFISLALQIHGKDVENDDYPAGDDPSAGLNLDNPEKYYLRNAVAHIKRALDFLYSQPEVDTTRIAAVGTSQGGGLALLISELDQRIKATSATIPTLISFNEALSSGAYWRVRKAIKNKIIDKRTALNTLFYFDAQNFSNNITNPILLSCHFKDRISPPNTIISFYNQLLTTNKHLIIQPELGHQFPEHHWDITIDWLKMIFKM